MRRQWRYEGEVVRDCVECARVVAVHESIQKMWYVLYWFFMVFIGKTVYLAFDERGNLHRHASYITLSSRQNAKLFQVRLGGVFRRNCIFGHEAGNWKIIHGWRGNDLVVRDYRGWTLGPFPGNQQALFRAVERYPSVEAMLESSRLAAQVRDHLGTAMAHVILVALAQKTNGVKSRHVEEVRRLLEAALEDAFPLDQPRADAEALRVTWRDAARAVFRTASGVRAEPSSEGGAR